MRSTEPCSHSSKSHSKLENTEFCTTTTKQGWAWERPHSASVIHKVNYFIQLKTPLIFRSVIFELNCREREREISFQTSIINQSLYRNLLDQNSRLVRFYGASHIFSAARKTPARRGKVRHLKCDRGSWGFVIFPDRYMLWHRKTVGYEPIFVLLHQRQRILHQHRIGFLLKWIFNDIATRLRLVAQE